MSVLHGRPGDGRPPIPPGASCSDRVGSSPAVHHTRLWVIYAPRDQTVTDIYPPDPISMPREEAWNKS